MSANSQIPSTKQKYDLESRTTEFAKRIVRLCREIPNDTVTRPLISQVIRSSGSVGANYREANDAISKKDFSYRIRVSRKEAKESSHWLQIMVESCPEFKATIVSLIDEADQLKRILSTIAQKVS